MTVVGAAQIAQARPTVSPTPLPKPPTTPIPPRPSSSGVAQNSGAFVSLTTVTTNSSTIKPATTGKGFVRLTTDP